jgi:hypothetical protein
MFENSVIRKTGQLWKMYVFFCGAVIGGLIMFYGLANLENNKIGLAFSLAGMGAGIISFVFGCVSIRCPKCKAPWLWQGVSGKSSKGWLHWLLSRSECPKCKYEKST